jgi:predicted nucleotidyltransferase
MPASTLERLRAEKRDAILAIAAKHGIQSIRVFGSVARGDDHQDSDIDFLISLDENCNVHDWLGFQHDLEDLLQRKIDVFPERNIRQFIKSSILAEAQPL